MTLPPMLQIYIPNCSRPTYRFDCNRSNDMLEQLILTRMQLNIKAEITNLYKQGNHIKLQQAKVTTDPTEVIYLVASRLIL